MINLIATTLRRILSDGQVNQLAGWLRRHGIRTEDWNRRVMYDQCFGFVRSLSPQGLDALEISPGPRWGELGFRSFATVEYPEFDICTDVLDRDFDLIIADQVFEHLLWPYRAGKNVYSMLRPGGHFIICTPFLVRVHEYPVDCTRWTETGLRYFLAECGFDLDRITTGSWGNRACIRADFRQARFGQWAKKGVFSSLRNEPAFAVSVWAYARR